MAQYIKTFSSEKTRASLLMYLISMVRMSIIKYNAKVFAIKGN
tara:strand:- start:91 stop:219 length:129 start_codon:yes stop_codon:yes gene_type:complete